MTVEVHLPDELASRLAAEARRRGVGLNEIASEIVEAGLATSNGDTQLAAGRRKLALVGVGASVQSLGAARADEMLAQGFGRD